jgi:hypothetical protein
LSPQNGVVPPQSVSAAHCTQSPSALHFDADAGQSAGLKHCTHCDLDVLHRGLSPLQLASEVHPAMHTRVRDEHTGREPVQSELFRHWRHRPATQRGAEAAQSVLEAHCTQTCESVLHAGNAWLQSELLRHDSHAPVVVSQYCATNGHPEAPAALHEAWHWWSPGQHAGALAPQSALERQATHAPVWQNLVPPPQSPSLTHSTQPRDGSHLALPPQAFALAHTLPAGTAPLLLEPPHAPASATPKSPTKQRTRPRPRKRPAGMRTRVRMLNPPLRRDGAATALRPPTLLLRLLR